MFSFCTGKKKNWQQRAQTRPVWPRRRQKKRRKNLSVSDKKRNRNYSSDWRRKKNAIAVSNKPRLSDFNRRRRNDRKKSTSTFEHYVCRKSKKKSKRRRWGYRKWLFSFEFLSHGKNIISLAGRGEVLTRNSSIAKHAWPPTVFGHRQFR